MADKYFIPAADLALHNAVSYHSQPAPPLRPSRPPQTTASPPRWDPAMGILVQAAVSSAVWLEANHPP